jgi:hypothetical protein
MRVIFVHTVGPNTHLRLQRVPRGAALPLHLHERTFSCSPNTSFRSHIGGRMPPPDIVTLTEYGALTMTFSQGLEAFRTPI